MKSLSRVRVVFVACPIMNRIGDEKWIPILQDSDKESPHLGVYLLVGILEREGIDIDLIDWVASFPATPEEIAEKMARYDLAFFSANSMNWPTVLNLAKITRKKHPRIITCIGGPHPTHYPESVIRSGVFDAYYRGDADRWISAIHDLLINRKSYKINIPGLGFCSKGKVGIPNVKLENNLDTVAAKPAYWRIPKNKYLVIPVETSRGCKFNCKFCSISSKNNWRGNSWEKAVEKIKYANQFSEHCRTGRITIIDNTFTVDHDRIQNISRKLNNKIFKKKLIYDASIIDLQDENLVNNLSFVTSDLLVGAEVSSKSQAKLINKAVNPHMIKIAARNLQKYNLSKRAVFSFIIGFPWQTKEICLEVVRFVKDLILEYGIRAYIQWYWPIPGSEIWSILAKEGLLDLDIIDEPGLFNSEKLFYSIRKITSKDVANIGNKIAATQMILQLSSSDQRARPIEYSTPFVKKENWYIKRDPLLY